MRRALIGVAGGLLVALVAVLACLNAHRVTPGELAQRCAASRPQWPSYQEDIKGQIGARPVAQWQGVPVHAEQSASALRVTFRIDGPWAGYACALPILLQDPLGNVFCSAETEGAGAERTYRFAWFAQEHASVLPWVTIRFPRGEKRLIFDQNGRWVAPGH